MGKIYGQECEEGGDGEDRSSSWTGNSHIDNEMRLDLVRKMARGARTKTGFRIESGGRNYDSQAKGEEKRGSETCETRSVAKDTSAEELQYAGLEGMEEPMGELTVWTNEREKILHKVVVSQLTETDAGKVNPGLLEETTEKYTEMLTQLTARDILEEDSRKGMGMAQPCRGMAIPDWIGARFPIVAEELHTAFLQDRWAKMEGRNKRRFLATFPKFTREELQRLTAKPSDALQNRYDMDLRDAIRS